MFDRFGLGRTQGERALWGMLFATAPHELRRCREDQIAYLARYGRQPMVGWDTIRTRRFVRMYRAVGRIIQAENELSNSDD